MDFKIVFENLFSAFHKNNVRYGLIGGFAMGLYGYSRATTDIDFLLSDIFINLKRKYHNAE
jgi:hypothetical protein